MPVHFLSNAVESKDKKKASKILKEIGKGKIKLNYLGSSCGYNGESSFAIHFVASMKKDGSCKRTWGWYFTEKEAREAVKRNAADMYEFYYTYTVIERVFCGIPSFATVVDWYKWNSDKKDPQGWAGTWKICKPPKFSEGTCNWSIG